jgi:uncharacterized membrane protein YcaP (DUF421 family)
VVSDACRPSWLRPQCTETWHLRREGLDQETLEAAVREHGVARLEDVEIAVLEIDGSISVVPAGAETRGVKRVPKHLRQA